MSIRLVIVDDEQPARRKLTRLLATEPDIVVVAEARDGAEAVETVHKERPDVVLLDIQMPGMDGFQVIQSLYFDPLPEFVFVTAYDEFALRAFKVNALDYLLKPFDTVQFQAMLRRVRRRLEQKNAVESNRLAGLLAELNKASRYAERILIPVGERAFLLEVNRIDWIEAAKNYVTIHAGPESHLIRGTLQGLHGKLNPNKFLRINRSQIVNSDFIKELNRWFHGDYQIILRDGTEVMWRRQYLDQTAETVIRRF